MGELPSFVAAVVAELPPGWALVPPENERADWHALPPEHQRGHLFIAIVDAPWPSVDCRCQAVKRNSYRSDGWIDRERGRDSMLGYYVRMMCETATAGFDPLTGREWAVSDA